MKRTFLFAGFLCFLTTVHAADWHQWRGPGSQGKAPEGAYPNKWGADSGLAWKIALPGRGCSTPVVTGDRILVTCPANGVNTLLCLDRDGKQQWVADLGPERPGKHRNGSGSNPSPVTDGELVFVYFKSGALAGLDLDGKILWKTNLLKTYTKDTLFWDIGTSPVLTEKHVVMAVMHSGGSYLAAYEKATGKLPWKADRNYTCPVEGDHSYNTPIVYRAGSRERILVWGAEHLTGHEADTGKMAWSCGGFNPEKKRNWVTVASPVIAGNMAVLPYARGDQVIGVKLGGKNDITSSHKAWKREGVGAFVPTPSVDGDRVVVLGDKGPITCIEATTGQTIWEGTLPKHRDKYYASPLLANGKLYCVREDGMFFVVRASEDFTILSEIDMGERMIASPVPMDGQLLLRGEKHLFCVER